MDRETRKERRRYQEGGQGGPVIINKRRSPASSLFWATGATIMTCVVCSMIIGLTFMSMADNVVDNSFGWLGKMSDKWPDWQRALPPVLGDAVNDVRSYEYGKLLTIDTRMVEKDGRRGRNRVIVEVKNEGDKTVSLLGLRVVIKDRDGDPMWEEVAYAATPLAIEDEWRGPLLPDQTRTFAISIHSNDIDRDATVKAEIVELRVWSGPVEREERSTRVPDAALSLPSAVAVIDEDEIHVPGKITIEDDDIDVPGKLRIQGDEINVIGRVKVSPDGISIPGRLEIKDDIIKIPGRITIGPDGIEVPGKFKIKDGVIEFSDGRRFPAQK